MFIWNTQKCIWNTQKCIHLLETYLIELYRFGILVGIGWYFLGILPTDTKGKLGW